MPFGDRRLRVLLQVSLQSPLLGGSEQFLILAVVLQLTLDRTGPTLLSHQLANDRPAHRKPFADLPLRTFAFFIRVHDPLSQIQRQRLLSSHDVPPLP